MSDFATAVNAFTAAIQALGVPVQSPFFLDPTALPLQYGLILPGDPPQQGQILVAQAMQDGKSRCSWVWPPGIFPVTLFGTGLTAVRNPAVDIDPHWRIVSPGADPTAYVVQAASFPHGSWVENDQNSQWISARPDSIGPANTATTYRQLFDTTNYDLGSLILTGRIAADNSAVMLLNGLPFGPAVADFSAFVPFSSRTGFIAGINTLDVAVSNAPWPAPNPTGLRAEVICTGTKLQ